MWKTVNGVLSGVAFILLLIAAMLNKPVTTDTILVAFTGIWFLIKYYLDKEEN